MDKGLDLMRMAIEESRANLSAGQGGPFGAVIARNGEVIAGARNRVLELNDPTMHAEVAAIRLACAKLGSFDLSGCEIYCSCEPCPMCLGAILWARIRTCHYACTRQDAAAIGFDDRAIYDYIGGDGSAMDLELLPCLREEALPVMTAWRGSEKARMY